MISAPPRAKIQQTARSSRERARRQRDTEKPERDAKQRIADVLQRDEHSVWVVLGQRRQSLRLTRKQSRLHEGQLDAVVDD